MSDGAAAPGSQASLREANSQRIVEAVKLYGRITQVELAAATGLSPATVSNIVRQLLVTGVVETSTTTRSGRRAQAVSLVRSSKLAAGVHIGRRAATVLIADASQQVSDRQHLPLPTDHRHDTTLDRIALLIPELVERVGADPSDLGGVQVALPATPVGAGRAGLPGWDGADVAGTLERRLAQPVGLLTEAEAVAVAEHRFGTLRGVGTSLVVRAGHVVDGCILIDGRIHRGSGVAGSLGHLRVDHAGRICWCGARGCLNTVVSSEALAEDLRVSHGPMTPRGIVAAAGKGDPGCRQVLADAGAAIGSVVADAACLLGLQRVVVAGELAVAAEVLLPPIRDALAARPILAAGLEVVPVSCDDPEARGALALAHDGIDPLGTTLEGGS
ncbi:ROK family transcriptional regulator [Arachnia propionica]|uniref:ROK family transcriptional regulator n=1 Tax=Arachnia propionica TaxID=1750 RepID=A0A3P1T4G1_9ACTN|nr:ROK family transcriptional regulator [Arachnia propionica]MDO5084338.1 ROK family transcriptional regulator [Arachnia propionica]RRD04204.1 ROK family transcriptional regulator [Arachnia propionica]